MDASAVNQSSSKVRRRHSRGLGGNLDEKGAGEFLDLSPRTLQRWRSMKPPQGPRFLRYSARCVRYRIDDLVAWRDAQAVEAQPAQSA